MLVIPAIDLRGGNCVRLKMGDFSRETIFSDDPVATALRFQNAGAKWLHIVDLDAAGGEDSENNQIILKLIERLEIPVQIGGGIRTLEKAVYWLEKGAGRIVIGTIAVNRPDIMAAILERCDAQQVVLAVDARDGMVAVDGWRSQSRVSAIDLALRYKGSGLDRVLYTDIQKDGMMSGPALKSTEAIAKATGLKVIASGGVSSFRDIEALKVLQPVGVDSVVVGRAFYEDKLSPEDVF